jgi:hypothetical protein
MPSDFRSDREESSAAPDIHAQLEESAMRRDNRWRHIPQRPRGFYAEYLDQLIAENRSKRNPAASNEAQEQYWRDRERFHAEQQKFNDAA